MDDAQDPGRDLRTLNPGCLLVGGIRDGRWVTAIDLAGDRVLVRYVWPRSVAHEAGREERERL